MNHGKRKDKMPCKMLILMIAVFALAVGGLFIAATDSIDTDAKFVYVDGNGNTYEQSDTVGEIVISSGTGSGIMGPFTSEYTVNDVYAQSFDSVYIEGSITEIGAYAFYNCSGLTTVKLSEGLTTIADYAFAGCNNSNLVEIVLPSTVTTIGAHAFDGCNAVKTIAIPTAETDLVYDGTAQTGVKSGVGYNIAGNVQTNAGSYNATASLQSGYKWSDGTTENKSISWSINQAGITGVSLKAGKTFTYIGSNIIPSFDDLTITVDSGTLTSGDVDISASDNKNVGTATVYITGKGNYSGIVYTNFTIGKATLKISAEDKQITYGDAKPAFTVNYESFVGSDDPSVLVGTLSFACSYDIYDPDNRGFGAYPITPSGLSSGNYDISYVPGTLFVDKLVVTLSWGTTAEDFVYDGSQKTFYANVTNTLYGDIPPDVTVLLNGDNVNVGSFTYIATFVDSDNYVISKTGSPVSSPEYTITPAAITGTMAQTNTLVYNKTEQTATAGGLTTVNSQKLTVGYSTADGAYGQMPTFTDAGSYKVYYEAKAPNHTDKKGTFFVTIEKKDITISGIAAWSRDYNGDTDATMDYDDVVYSGIISGDTLTVSATGTFAQKDASYDEIAVSITDLALGGASAGNYKLAATGQQTSTSAYIYQVSLTPSIDFSAIEIKTYNGYTNVDGTPGISLSGAISGENPTASAYEYQLTSKNVGTKGVTASYISLNNGWDTNYYLIETEVTGYSSQSLVTPKSIQDSSVVWNSPPADPIVYTGLDQSSKVIAYFGGVGEDGDIYLDGFTFTGTSGAAAGQTVFKNAGSYTVSGTTSNANYSLGTATETYTIGKAPLSITPKNKTITYGDAASNDGVTYDGFVNGETESVLGGTLSYTYSYDINVPASRIVGDYTIIITGLTSGNYNITHNTGTLTVVQKKATLEWTAPGNLIYSGAAKIPSVGVNNKAFAEDTFTIVSSLTEGKDNVNAGTFTFTVSALGNTNYSMPDDPVSPQYTIVNATPVIVLSNKSLTFNGSPIAIDAAAVTLKNGEIYSGTITYTYYSDPSCMVDATTTAPTDAGTYYVKATTPAFTNYDAGESNVATLNIGKKALSITVDMQKPYDGTELIATYSEFTTSDLVAGDSFTAGKLKTTGTDVYEYKVTPSEWYVSEAVATAKGIDNYAVSWTVSLEIVKAIPVKADFIFTAPTDLVYSGTYKSATVTTEKSGMGGFNIRYFTDEALDNEISVLNVKNVGTYYVAIDVHEGTNYTDVDKLAVGSFSIVNATPVIALSDKSVTYSGTPVVIDAATVTLKNGEVYSGTITYTYYTNSSCTEGATTTAPTNAGTYYVKATTPAFTNYNAGTSNVAKLTIGKQMPDSSYFDYTAPASPIVYSGTAKSATVTVKSDVVGMGQITVRYYSDSELKNEVSPINAGTYYVAIDVDEGENFTAESKIYKDSFTISKAVMANVPQAEFYYTGLTKYTVENFDTGVKHELVTLTYTPSSVNVGTYHYGSSPQFTITYSGVQNYKFGNVGDLLINKVELTPSIVFTGITSKVYDGTTVMGGTGAIALAGAVNGETPTATASFKLISKNVGTKGVEASSITLTGSWGTNYILSTNTVTKNASASLVTVRTVNVPGDITWSVSAPTYSKTDYGSTVTATFAGQGSDGTISLTVTFHGISGAATGEDVFMKAGTYTATGTNTDTNYVLSGECTNDYTIKQKDISVDQKPGTTITKVYDGTTTNTSTVTDYYVFDTLETGDAVSLTATLTYDSKDVLTVDKVIVDNLLLTGDDKDNYHLTTTSFYIEDATITERPLTMPNKYVTYDGSTNTKTFNHATGIGSETLNITYTAYSSDAAVYQYAAAAGEGKYTVSLADGTFGGLATNYMAASEGNGTFTIAVARIGDNGYPTVDAAIDAVTTGQTIILIDAHSAAPTVDLKSAKSTSVSFSIDLNGRTLDLSNVLTLTGSAHLYVNYNGGSVTGDIVLTDSSYITSTNDMMSIAENEHATSNSIIAGGSVPEYGCYASVDTAIIVVNDSRYSEALIEVCLDSSINIASSLEANRYLTIVSGKTLTLARDFDVYGSINIEASSTFYAGMSGHGVTSEPVDLTFKEGSEFGMSGSTFEFHGKLTVAGTMSYVTIHMYSSVVIEPTAKGTCTLIQEDADPINVSGTIGKGNSTDCATFNITGDAEITGTLTVKAYSAFNVNGKLTVGEAPAKLSNDLGSVVTARTLEIDLENTHALDGADGKIKLTTYGKDVYKGPAECLSHITTANQMYAFAVIEREEPFATFGIIILDVLPTQAVNSMSGTNPDTFTAWENNFKGKYDIVEIYTDLEKTSTAMYDSVYGKDTMFLYVLSLGPSISVSDFETEKEQTFTVTPEAGLITGSAKLIPILSGGASYGTIEFYNGTDWVELSDAGVIISDITTVSTYQFKTTFSTIGNMTLTARITDSTGTKIYDENTVMFTVVKGAPVYNAPAAKELVYSGSDQTLVSAGSTGDGTLKYSLSETGTYSSALTDIIGKDAGTYTVYYFVEGDSDHKDTAIASLNVTIAKAQAVVTGIAAKTLTYKGSPQALVTAGSSTFGTIQYKIKNGDYSTSVPKQVGAGTYYVYYKVDGTSNYYGVSETEVVASIQKAAGFMTLPKIKTGLVYTGSALDLITAGSSTTGTLWYKLGETEYTKSVPTAVDAGTYDVYYKLVGDDQHLDIIVDSPLTITIARADIILTTTPAIKTGLGYTGSPLELITSGAVKGGQLMYNIAGITSFGTEIPTATNAGTYTIGYKAIGDSNHNDSMAVLLGDVVITKATPSVTAPVAKNGLVYDGSLQELVSAGSTTGGQLQYKVDDGSYSVAIPAAVDAKTSYTVYYKVVGGTNYKDADEQSFTVSIAKATPTVVAPTARTGLVYTGSAMDLIGAGTTDFGTMQYKVGSGSYSANIPQGTDATGYTVGYKVAGDSNHNEVTGNVLATIAAAKTVISGITAKDLVFNGTDQTLVTLGTSNFGTIKYAVGSGSYGSNPTAKDAGTYTVYYKVDPTSANYLPASGDIKVTIAPKDLSSAVIVLGTDLTYNGAAQTQTLSSVHVDGISITADTDYAVKHNTGKDAGTYQLSIMGIDNYCGTALKDFSIAKKELSDSMIIINSTYTYKSVEQKVSFTVTDTGLTTSDWYIVSGNSGINAGTYSLVIGATESGNYYGTAKASWTIAKATPSLTAPAAIAGLVYNGSTQELVSGGSTTGGAIWYKIGAGSYSTAVPSAVNASSYTVYYKVVGGQNYKDIEECSTPILASISKAAPTVVAPTAKTGLVYTGSALVLANIGYTNIGTMEYKLSTVADYGSSVPSATSAGEYTIDYRVAATTNYSEYLGSIVASIGKAQAAVTGVEANDLTFTGTSQYLIKSGTSTFGTVQYKVGSGSYATSVPKGINAGQYYAYYKVDGTSDYYGVTETQVPVTIAKAPLALKFIGAKTFNNSQYTVQITNGMFTGLVSGDSVASGSMATVGNAAKTYSDVGSDITVSSLQTSKGISNYDLSYAVSMTIDKKALTSAMIVNVSSPIYNGLTQMCTFTVSDTGVTDSDWKIVSGNTGKDAGTYTLVISATESGNYTGTVSKNWVLQKADAIYELPMHPSMPVTYNGSEQEIAIPGKTNGGTWLYMVKYMGSYTEYSEDIPVGINAGVYEVYFKLDGGQNFNDIKQEMFSTEIMKALPSVVDPVPIGGLIYNGQPQELITAGTSSIGTLEYTLDGLSYSETIPSVVNAGDYTIKVRIEDPNIISYYSSVNCHIDKAIPIVTAPAAKDLTYAFVNQILIEPGTTTGGVMVYSFEYGGSYVPYHFEMVKEKASVYKVYYKVNEDENFKSTSPQFIEAAIKKLDISGAVVYYDPNSLTYTGAQQKQIVSGVTLNEYYLTDTVDYKVEGNNVTDAGRYSMTVFGINSCSGSVTKEFTVAKKGLSNSMIAVSGSYTYTGVTNTLSFSVSDGTALKSSDWTIVSGDTGLNAGSYTLKIAATEAGNYSGTAKVSWSIAKANISLDAPVGNDLTYSGSAQKLVTGGTAVGGTIYYTLTGGSGYSVSIPLGTDADTYTVYYKVVGDSNHNDLEQESFDVVLKPKSISLTDFESVGGAVYTGSQITPALRPIVPMTSDDYTVTYGENINVVTGGTVYVTAKNNYTGTAVLSFEIVRADSTLSTLPQAKSLTYSGSAQKLVSEGASSTGTVWYKLLGGEYTESIPSGTDADTYTVYYKVVGDSNHKDLIASSPITVTIKRADVSYTAPTAKTGLVYTGNVIELVNDGTVVGGELQYSLNGASFRAIVPTAVDADTYGVSYRIVGDSNHNDVAAVSLGDIVIDRADAKIKLAPISKNLYYSKLAQELVSAGTSDDGTVMYRLGSTGDYSSSIPTAVDADTYTVYYMVKGDSNHNDLTDQTVSATIAPCRVYVSNGPSSISKVYDGTVSGVSGDSFVKGLHYVFTGMLGTDEVDFVNSANVFDVKTVDAKNVTVTDLALTDSNYTITSAVLKAEISARPMSITVYDSKAFDGTVLVHTIADTDTADLVAGASFTAGKIATTDVIAKTYTVKGTDWIISEALATNDGIENYSVTFASVTLVIGKMKITVTPDSGLSKRYLDKDPVLTYTYSGQQTSQVPGFSGALARAAGEDVGYYEINAGTLKLVDNGTFIASNYSLEVVSGVQFEITAKVIAAGDFKVDLCDETYTGSAITKTVTSDLALGTEYTVTYVNNILVGTAGITFTGIGDYSGTVSMSFNIVKRVVDVPEELYYIETGSKIVFELPTSPYYTETSGAAAEGTEPGTYVYTFALDPNCKWSESGFDGTYNVYITLKEVEHVNENGVVDVIITGTKGIRKDLTLSVSASGDVSKIQGKYSFPNGTPKYCYDISFTKDGSVIQPVGTLTVTMLIPGDMKAVQYEMYHIHDGVVTKLDKSADGDYVSVQTDDFSEFVFVSNSTFNSMLIIGIVALILVLISIYFLCVRKGKKDKSEKRAAKEEEKAAKQEAKAKAKADKQAEKEAKKKVKEDAKSN